MPVIVHVPTIHGKVLSCETVNWLDISLNFAINVVAAFFVFLVGLFWNRIPRTIRDYRMRHFWGNDLFGGRFVVCHGTLQVDRSRHRTLEASPFIKVFRDGAVVRIAGPSENVMGDSEIRSTSYLVKELSMGLKSPIAIEPDNKAFSRLNGTLIAVGSGSSNEVTRLILNEPNNNQLDFLQEGDDVCVYEKTTGRKYFGFRPPLAKDYGIIVKLPNLRFPGSFLFVCAGLGDWGTSGAAWYLAANWDGLYSRYPGPFGIVVEVDIGSDESARLASQSPSC